MITFFTRILIVKYFISLTKFPDGLSARGGAEDGSEEWGYIPIRPGASMFYWFYRTTHPDGYLERPLILWLQGGPGLSGTGIGNFLEFGPLDQNLEPRNSTWIQTTNIIIVDNPVGVGFSIANNKSDIPKNVEEISEDLISVLKIFLEEHPYFQTTPLYIFGQSYGGKMTAALTYYLHKAIGSGEIKCNLKGAGIGNGMVSHSDNMVTHAPMLYGMSLLDDIQLKNLSDIAWKAYWDGENGQWESVIQLWSKWVSTVYQFVPPVSFYSIMDLSRVDESKQGSVYDINIDELMNGHVREKLKIIPDDKRWNNWYEDAFFAQYDSHDALKPVWHLVDEVLKTSDIDVVVYSGQLDIICSTAGALRWMNKLTWEGKTKFDKAERKLLANPDTQKPEMFVKAHDTLKMYWILNSGHVVPADVPDAALRMLNRILDDTD